ncbi:MAG: hypothetical protein ROY99_13555 [Ignavibacterium sp.]|nr:hypothetical protein [Ignavibacterium sp.]
MNSLIIKILVIAFLLIRCLYPQNPDKQIYLSVSPMKALGSSDFENIWSSDIGILGEFRFEHPVGQLGVGLSLMKFDSYNDITLGFYGIDYYFLYRNYFELFSDFSLMAGFDFGIYEFRFEDADLFENPAGQIEREFALKLVSGIDFKIYNTWSAELGLGYSYIYTRKKIELLSFRIGLVKSFTAPAWLSEFFE